MNPLSTAHGSADDSSQLTAALDVLTTRVDTFEHELEEAIRCERAFQHSLQSVSHLLDSFIEAHQREDGELSRLVAMDTRRTQEMQEEYEVLAGRFSEAFQVGKNGAWRSREVLGMVWLYAGILVSVVFMAPLHLIVFVVERLVGRLGIGKRGGKGRETGRGGRCRVSKRGRGKVGKVRKKKGGDVGKKEKDADNVSKVEIEDGIEHGKVEESCKEDEVFVDAIGSANIVCDVGGVEKTDWEDEDEEEGEEDDEQEGEDGERERRPDWARPEEDDREDMAMEGFPSNEFWEISDEDIRIDLLTKEEED